MSGQASWNIDTTAAQLGSFTFAAELADIADHRPDIVMLTADLTTSNRGGDFLFRHPQRYFDVGIAEQNMMGIAAGLASCGYRPFVTTFASFASLLCAEHLRTDLAYTQMPVCVLAHHAGISMGFYGTSHHAVEDIALTRAISGLNVISPCDGNATRAAVRAALEIDGPTYVRLGRGREPDVYDAPPNLRPGKWINLRTGTDGTLIATGLGVHLALGAASALSQRDGIEMAVVDAAWLKPIDEAAIADAAGRGLIITVEEHNPVGGLTSAVAEVLVGLEGPRVPLRGCTLPDGYSLVAPPSRLYRRYGLTIEGVTEQARQIFEKGRPPR